MERLASNLIDHIRLDEETKGADNVKRAPLAHSVKRSVIQKVNGRQDAHV